MRDLARVSAKCVCVCVCVCVRCSFSQITFMPGLKAQQVGCYTRTHLRTQWEWCYTYTVAYTYIYILYLYINIYTVYIFIYMRVYCICTVYIIYYNTPVICDVPTVILYEAILTVSSWGHFLTPSCFPVRPAGTSLSVPVLQVCAGLCRSVQSLCGIQEMVTWCYCCYFIVICSDSAGVFVFLLWVTFILWLFYDPHAGLLL